MAVVHGKTAAGSIVPLKVAADGALSIDGTITLGAVTVEASFGGIAEHWNGSASDTPSSETFSDVTRSILIDNIGVTNSLYFSLDGGTKWKSIGPEASINISCDLSAIDLKCATGETTDYEIIAVIAE